MLLSNKNYFLIWNVFRHCGFSVFYERKKNEIHHVWTSGFVILLLLSCVKVIWPSSTRILSNDAVIHYKDLLKCTSYTKTQTSCGRRNMKQTFFDSWNTNTLKVKERKIQTWGLTALISHFLRKICKKWCTLELSVFLCVYFHKCWNSFMFCCCSGHLKGKPPSC